VMLSEGTRFTMGSDVLCTDGSCGVLRQVVLDPVARALTHLVVRPGHNELAAHLVPIGLVRSAGPSIELSCSLVEFDKLEQAQELRFRSDVGGDEWGYERGELLTWPYYGLGVGAPGGVGLGGVGRSPSQQPAVTPHDNVPPGEVKVHRGEHVHATDGPIGRVQGLVVDPRDHRVTHVLLDEGHLWGQKQVAIPISSVKDVDGTDGVHLELTKDQVRDLPAIELDDQE